MDSGLPPRDMAVLVRANAHTEGLERAFADAGVPCQVRGAERFFDRAEVRQATGLLRTAARSARPEAEAAGPPAAGSAGAAPAAAAEVVAEVRHILAGLGLAPEPPTCRGAAPDRWESLAALARVRGGLRRTPSRFLTGMRPRRREARAARAEAGQLQFAGADQALVERLREWRREVARDAGV